MLSILNLPEFKRVFDYIQTKKEPLQEDLAYVHPITKKHVLFPYPKSIAHAVCLDREKSFFGKIKQDAELSAYIQKRLSLRLPFLPGLNETFLIIVDFSDVVAGSKDVQMSDDRGKTSSDVQTPLGASSKKNWKNKSKGKNQKIENKKSDETFNAGTEVKTMSGLDDASYQKLMSKHKSTTKFINDRCAALQLNAPVFLVGDQTSKLGEGLYISYSDITIQNGIKYHTTAMGLKSLIETISKHMKYHVGNWANMSIDGSIPEMDPAISADVQLLFSCFCPGVGKSTPYFNVLSPKNSMATFLAGVLPKSSAALPLIHHSLKFNCDYYDITVICEYATNPSNEFLSQMFPSGGAACMTVRRQDVEEMCAPVDEMSYYRKVVKVINPEIFTIAIRSSRFSLCVKSIVPNVSIGMSICAKTFQRFLSTKSGMFAMAGIKGIGKTTLTKILDMPSDWIIDSDYYGRAAAILYKRYEISDPTKCRSFKNRAGDDVKKLLIEDFDMLSKDIKNEGGIRSLFEDLVDQLLLTNSPILKGISHEAIAKNDIHPTVIVSLNTYLSETVRQLIDPRSWDSAISYYLDHKIHSGKTLPKIGPIILNFCHSSFEYHSTIGTNVCLIEPVMSPYVHMFGRSFMSDVTPSKNLSFLTDVLLYRCYLADEQHINSGVPITMMANFFQTYVNFIDFRERDNSLTFPRYVGNLSKLST